MTEALGLRARKKLERRQRIEDAGREQDFRLTQSQAQGRIHFVFSFNSRAQVAAAIQPPATALSSPLPDR